MMILSVFKEFKFFMNFMGVTMVVIPAQSGQCSPSNGRSVDNGRATADKNTDNTASWVRGIVH